MRYERGRLARIVVAGVAATLAALSFGAFTHPFVGFLVRGTTTVVVYAGLLWATGFFRATERAFIGEMARRLRRWGAPAETGGRAE